MLIHPAASPVEGKLVLHVEDSWSADMDEGDAEYIAAIFENCGEVEGPDSEELFEHIAQMSAGTLRADAPTSCSALDPIQIKAILSGA